MSTALENNGVDSNIALQAESLVMAKEHLIEAYGELRYTIGTGCSGGSLTQQWVANAYPGIYQGLLPTCSFPDVWSTGTQIVDYNLLLAYFDNPLISGTAAFTPTQWAAVEGNALPVDAIVSDFGYIKEDGAFGPTFACADVTSEQRYDPTTNPGGVRCGVPDFSINVLGPRLPSVWTTNEKNLGHGFAGLAVDNVGVQYGLSALQQGLILPFQFLDLNAKIGGLDVDINPIPQRMVADEPALTNAYRSGSINETTNLDQVAIIDGRGPDPGVAHDVYRVFAVRARLDREHGTHANQVIWEGPIPLIGDVDYTVNGLIAIDRWLATVEQDQSSTSLQQKLIKDKPADIVDECYDGAGTKLYDGLCPAALVAAYGTPRTVAGDDITTDANKCRLKPLDRRDDYGPLPFTDDQWMQMMTIFPNGVCDFSQPGVDQQPTLAWQSYQDSSGNAIYGGQTLPKAPVGVASGWADGGFTTGQ